MANSQPTIKTADTASTRNDPIGDRYFRPLRIADSAADWLFWIAAALSFAVILIDKETAPKWYNKANIAFVLAVVSVFIIGIISRLYLSPRAEDGRRRDLFTNSFNIDLTHERTTGYYNNDETNSFRRLALSVMESSFFTSRICQAMLYRTRIATAVYFAAWLCLVLSRETDLGLVAAAAQALFSEIFLSKWLRLEWLRRRSEEACTHLSQLLKTARSFNKELTRAQALEHVSYYEMSKSNAGIVLSDAIFKKLNPSLSAEWESILKTLPKSTASPSVRKV
jgi:hypothetical protein